MDCDRFEEVAVDALYGELDGAVAAELRRHLDVCPRCAKAMAELQRTREAARTLWVDPPGSIIERALSAEREFERRAPWYRKVLRLAAWAGSHAMHPQLAMAALFVFVAGSSLLLLRDRDRTVASPVSVSERGAPVRLDETASKVSAEARAPQPRAAADEPRLEAAGPASPAPEANAARAVERPSVGEDCARPGGDAPTRKGSGEARPPKRPRERVSPCPASGRTPPRASAAPSSTSGPVP